jgi:lipopolysaccharide transport system ATP-binding protein
MYVRLAFAVAAHLEPEILVIDEVLAVGDAEFQRKCLAKMDEASQRQGRTVLFVSHNVGVVTTLCPTAIWLDRGGIRQQGAAKLVVSRYLAEGMTNQERIVRLNDSSRRHSAGDDHVLFESLEWLSDFPLRHGQPLKARIHFTTRSPVEDIAIGIGFSGLEGKRLLTYETDFPDGFRPSFAHSGSYSVDIEVDSLPLGPDLYALDIGCRSGDFHSLAYIPSSMQVDVVAGPTTPGAIARKDSGVRLPSKWSWNV